MKSTHRKTFIYLKQQYEYSESCYLTEVNEIYVYRTIKSYFRTLIVYYEYKIVWLIDIHVRM